MKNCKHILISRTDSIGDIVLSLPLAGLIRQIFPKAQISFLGQSYTKPVLDCCEYIDAIYCWDQVKNKSVKELADFFKSMNIDAILHVFPNKKVAEAAKTAGVKYRIGTARRFYHLTTCNELINLPRKNSDLHEAQLNIKLLKALNYDLDCPQEDLPKFYGLNKIEPLNPKFTPFIAKEKFNLILHPKSKGSAREWGLSNFSDLINQLPAEKFNILITGTEEEGDLIKGQLPFDKSNVTNLTGLLALNDLISLINNSDGLLAASTGPLHLAAALNKHALGIYAPMRPIHPGRWAPLGSKAKVFVENKSCEACRVSLDCACIKGIPVNEIKNYLLSLV